MKNEPQLTEKNVKFNLFSLIRFKLVQNDKNYLQKVLLYSLDIKSQNATYSMNNYTNQFSVNYSFPKDRLKEILNEFPLEENFYERIKDQIYITLTFNSQDIIKIFYQIDYGSLSKTRNIKTKIFFYVQKIKYSIKYNTSKEMKEKNIYLFIYKNMTDEIDNLKLLNLVFCFNLPIEHLTKLMFNNDLKNKFFLNNKDYNDNIVKETGNLSLSKIVEKTFDDSGVEEFIWMFLSFVSYRIITYYEMGTFLQKYKEIIISNIEKNKINFYLSLKEILINNKDNNENCIKFDSSSLMSELEKNLEKKKSINNIKIYERLLNDKKVHKKEFNFLRKIKISNFSCFFELIGLERTSRITRKYLLPNELIYVYFESSSSSNLIFDNYCKLTRIYIEDLPKKKFKLLEKEYTFLTFSSQQDFFSFYLVSDINKALSCFDVDNDNGSLISIKDYSFILQKMLSSSIIPIKKLPSSVVIANLKKTKDFLFENPNGFISYEMADEISKKLKLKFIPSYFEAMINGIYGNWAIINEDNNQKKNFILYYPRMKFFNAKVSYFEVFSYSKYKPGYITLDLLKFFENCYLPDKVIKDKLKYFLGQLQEGSNISPFFDMQFTQRFMKEFYTWLPKIKNDSFTNNIQNKSLELVLKKFQRKNRIYLKNSAILKCIIDFKHYVPENQAFCVISKTNTPEDPNNIHLKGEYIVIKLPFVSDSCARKIKFFYIEKEKLETEKERKRLNVLMNSTNSLIFSKKNNFFEDFVEPFSDYLIIWDKDFNCLSSNFVIRKPKKRIERLNFERCKEELYDFQMEERNLIREKSYDERKNKTFWGMESHIARVLDLCKNRPCIKNNMFLDYKNIGTKLLSETPESYLDFFYIRSIPLVMKQLDFFNKEVEGILNKLNLNSCEELLFYEQYETRNGKEINYDYILQKMSELKEIILADLTQSFLSEKFSLDTLINYYDKIYILSTLSYNCVHNIDKIKEIFYKHYDNIKKENFNLKEDVVEEINNLHNIDSFTYIQFNYGINNFYDSLDDEIRENKEDNSKEKEKNFKPSLFEEIKNFKEDVKYLFCYYLFIKYIGSILKVK